MPLVHSVYNAFLDPKVWELGPEEVKQKESLKYLQQTVHVDSAKIFYMVWDFCINLLNKCTL